MLADMTRLPNDAQISRWSTFPFRAKIKLWKWLKGERGSGGNKVLDRKVWQKWMISDITEALSDTHLTRPDEQDPGRLLDRMAATFPGVLRQDRPEVQLAQGAAVTIDGLNRCTEYNGQRGIISSNLLDGRYEVWVESARTTVKVRPQNLLEVNVRGEGKREIDEAALGLGHSDMEMDTEATGKRSSPATSSSKASRCCAVCEVGVAKSEYSKNQWKKGPGMSVCKECVRL